MYRMKIAHLLLVTLIAFMGLMIYNKKKENFAAATSLAVCDQYGVCTNVSSTPPPPPSPFDEFLDMVYSWFN